MLAVTGLTKGAAADSKTRSAADGRGRRIGGPVHGCTIIARNYLAYARVLAESFLVATRTEHSQF